MKGEGEGKKETLGAFFKIVGFAGERFLLSPPRSFLFFALAQFSRRTRAETLATQASYACDFTVWTPSWTGLAHCPRSHARPLGSGIYMCGWNYSANATNSVFLLRAAFSLLVGFAASRHVLFRFTLTHLSAVSPQVSEVLLSYSNFP